MINTKYTLQDFKVGDNVVVDGHWLGMIVGFKDFYIVVEDQDGDCFDVESCDIDFDAE